MEVSCENRENTVVVTVKGRIDAVTAPEFERECVQSIEQGERSIVVDLSQLEYISSAGLRSILVVFKKLKAVDGRIAFSGARDMVLRVLSLANFTSMFPVYDSLDEALAQIQR
jgi:anti-anti-sigma factor